MQKPLTPTQLKVLEWQSTRPAFVGTVRAEHLPGKAERQTAKRQAIKKASAR